MGPQKSLRLMLHSSDLSPPKPSIFFGVGPGRPRNYFREDGITALLRSRVRASEYRSLQYCSDFSVDSETG